MLKDLLSSISAAPLTNLVVVCFTVIVALVIIGALLRGANVIQLGSFTIRKEQEGQTTMHAMNEENDDLDDYLHMKLRQMTNALRQRIVNMFCEYHSCTMTKRALSSALRFPLYESVNNNHFTKELMPGYFDKYRQRILGSLEDEYKDISTSASETDCESNDLPTWRVASVIIEQLLDVWLRETANAVQDCSRQKLEVYARYLTQYEESHDKFRTSITKACIEKNTRYIEALDRLAENLDRDIKDREEKLQILG